MIAFTEAAGRARSFCWDGAQLFGPENASTNSGHSFGLAASPDGRFRLALEQAGGDIALLQYNPASGWTNVATIATNALPFELRLTTLTNNAGACHLLTWVSGADAATLHYVFTDASGSLLKPPGSLTDGAEGRYSDLHVLAGADKGGKVIVRFHGGTGSVRVLTISFDNAPTLAHPVLLPTGTFEFDLLGTTQRHYRVQKSADLGVWMDLTNVLATNAVMRVRDPSASNSPLRFYRAVQP
jgi:hypothetical protein